MRGDCIACDALFTYSLSSPVQKYRKNYVVTMTAEYHRTLDVFGCFGFCIFGKCFIRELPCLSTGFAMTINKIIEQYLSGATSSKSVVSQQF